MAVWWLLPSLWMDKLLASSIVCTIVQIVMVAYSVFIEQMSRLRTYYY